MDNPLINFHLYRYHLLPLNNKKSQNLPFSIDDIKEKKNQFFADELEIMDKHSQNSKNPLKLELKNNNYYLLKIAQKKSTTITKNFQTAIIENEPYVYVVINNDSNVQKIAISANVEAFSHPDVVKNIIKKLLQSTLEKHGLNIEIEPLFNAVNFWKYIERHKDELTYLNFQFIKPNLANISSSLPEDFKKFAEDVNSHESHISLKAPEKGRLHNIDKNNKEINGLVEYASKGAGSIKLKVKNIRKTLSTKENPIIIEINDLSLEGPADKVIDTLKTIVE